MSPERIAEIIKSVKKPQESAFGGTLSGLDVTRDNSMVSLMPAPSNQISKKTLGVRNNSQSFAMTEPIFNLPEIKIKYPRNVITGTGIDEVYTKKETDMQKLMDEHKNLKTETNQLKLANEKLVDRVELMNNIIEKEASAHTYMYNYPPKGDVKMVTQDKDAGKPKKEKKDNENNKVKKMYEDMME